jgi:hypothetical protein
MGKSRPIHRATSHDQVITWLYALWLQHMLHDRLTAASRWSPSRLLGGPLRLQQTVA